MLKIKAQILMSGPDPQPLLAEGQLRRARELARDQSALSWELRIAIDWLRIRQSDRTRLRTLQGVYAWFTQGFDTPDLDLALRVLEAEQHQEALAASCTPSQL